MFIFSKSHQRIQDVEPVNHSSAGALRKLEDANIGVAGFLDVETTGLSSSYDEVIELAICLFKFRRDTGQIYGIIDHYTGLREPSRSIPSAASRVHGIYQNDVKGQKLDNNRILTILNQAECLIAHNASFDRGFVTKLFNICENKHWLCSMRGIKWKAKGFTSAGLQNLLSAHGIKVERSHRAEDDVKNALKLLNLSYGGKTYFLELIEKHSYLTGELALNESTIL